jgi:hypothetical protein
LSFSAYGANVTVISMRDKVSQHCPALRGDPSIPNLELLDSDQQFQIQTVAENTELALLLFLKME